MRGRRLLASAMLVATLVATLTAGCGVRPSGVIPGGPAPVGHASGVVLYFLSGSSLTPVFRPIRQPISPTKTLAFLQEGPDDAERAANLTSEVPSGLDPVDVTTHVSGDVEIVVSFDVRSLSAAAVDQVVCTVRDTLTTTASITLSSDGATRGPRSCPFPG